jgi:hypothetical protein
MYYNLVIQKVYFLAVNRSLRWLNNVSGVYLVQVSLLLIGQQGLGHFFRYRSLLFIGWRIVQLLRQRRSKTTNTTSTTLSAIQLQQANLFLSMHKYMYCTSLVISGNDKNKQVTVTLLSQQKIALTARNTLFALNII